MTSGFPDQRSGRILLVGHRVLNTRTVGTRRADGGVAVTPVVRWAQRAGVGVYQLPLPTYWTAQAGRAGSAQTTRNRNESDDAARIEFVYSQLSQYRAAGYEVPSAIAIAEDLLREDEQRWWSLFQTIGERLGWAALPLLTVGLDAEDFDIELGVEERPAGS